MHILFQPKVFIENTKTKLCSPASYSYLHVYYYYFLYNNISYIRSLIDSCLSSIRGQMQN